MRPRGSRSGVGSEALVSFGQGDMHKETAPPTASSPWRSINKNDIENPEAQMSAFGVKEGGF